MSEAVTFKCPNCGGELVFSPASGRFTCHYCGSDFGREQLDAQQPAQSTAGDALDGAVVYNCPSCGAQVVTDDTTAAAFCYYCHSPVVMAGRLREGLKPDKLIPFTIERNEAVKRFLDWVGKKWFVPPAFFCKQQIEKLSGVYFPYWVTDVDAQARLETQAATVRSWRSGNTEYTETKRFRVTRAGRLHFEDIETIALRKADKKLVEGVQPFDGTAMRPFEMSYLSGFQAEVRDIEKDEIRPEVITEVNGYTDSMLRDTIQGYTTIGSDRPWVDMAGEHWDYTMAPVWVLTYSGRGKKDKVYYFAMNGQTGKIFGELPVDWKRLMLLFAAVSLPVFAIGLAGVMLL